MSSADTTTQIKLAPPAAEASRSGSTDRRIADLFRAAMRRFWAHTEEAGEADVTSFRGLL